MNSVPFKRRDVLVAAVGCALFVAGLVFLDTHNPWAVLVAAVGTLGVAVVLMFGSTRTPIGQGGLQVRRVVPATRMVLGGLVLTGAGLAVGGWTTAALVAVVYTVLWLGLLYIAIARGRRS